MSIDANTQINNLEVDYENLETWCAQFEGLCPNDGDVYPPDFAERRDGISLGGIFLVRLSGRRFFIDVTDFEWQPYDYDREEGEEPYGYNLVSTTLIDIDRPEILFVDSSSEHEEDCRFQGVAHAVAAALEDGHEYPTGFWSDVLEVMTFEWGVLQSDD